MWASDEQGSGSRRRMRIYPDMVGRFRKTCFTLPCFSEVSRDKQCGAVLISRCGVENLGICGIDGQSCNHSQWVRLRENILVGVIGIHGNAFDSRWFGIHQVPAPPAIGTAPQARSLCVHRLGIQGIENKKADDSPQIEHPPGTTAVMRDVSTRHIASDQYCVDIMWADGGMEHGSSATGANDAKIPRSNRECAAQAGEAHG